MKKIFSLILMMAVFSTSLFAATYTVAGSSTAAFGSTWNPENTANDMTLVDGVYTLVKEDVTLPAGTLQYKVCQDHAWTKCWPSGDNATLAIAETAKYTLTFTFNLEKGAVNASANKTEDAQVDPTVSVKGAWDAWAAEVKFLLAEDKKSASATKELDPATYEFKAILNGGDWRSNGATITREAASVAGIDGNSDANMKLVADAKGNYTFTWTFASNTLAVTFPEKGDDPIVPPTPVDSMTVYFVNNLAWETVNAFVWLEGTGTYKDWPGEAMAKQAEKINDFDVYAYTFPASYVNVIFNNGSAQTVDLKWDAAKPYFVLGSLDGEKYNGTWYAKEDIPAGGDDPQPEKKLPVVSLAGTMNAWNAAANLFVPAEDSLSASLKIELVAALDSFKIVSDGKWLSLWGEPGTLFKVHRGWPRADHVNVVDGANFLFEADVDGEYTFTWTYADSTLVVTFPEKGDDPIVPPTPVDSMTVYFYNNLGWETVNAFVWPAEGAAYKEWPGEAAQKEAEQINDEDVYAYTFPASYVNVIFNNGEVQTADLKWDADKPYFVPSGEKNGEGKYTGTWYAKADIPADEPVQPADVMTVSYNGSEVSTPEGFFTHDASGKFNFNAKFNGATYDGIEFTSGLKFEGSTKILFTTAKVATVTIVQSTYSANTIKFDDVELAVSDAVEGTGYRAYTLNNVAAGDHSIKRGSGESGLFYVKVEYAGGEQPEEPAKYYLAGTMNEWTIGANEFVADGDTLRLSIALEADSVYEYKVVKVAKVTTWFGTGFPVTMEYGNSTDWHLDGNENAGLHTTKAANYDFIFVPKDNNRIDVIMPAPDPEVPKYYAKNNWDGVTDWTWKEMTMKSDDDYQLECVFGGTGVNINTAESDEGAAWYAAADIAAFDASYEPATLGALDTIVLMYTPSEKMLAALIIGKYAEPVTPPTPGTKYYAKNNWDGVTDWTWKEMTMKSDDDYQLECVFGGTGVNINTAESDEGAAWYAAADIAAFDASYEPATLGALDTIVLMYTPSEKMLAALIIGKYVAPVDPNPAKYYIAGTMTEWAKSMVEMAAGENNSYSVDIALEADSLYEFKVVRVQGTDTAWYGAGLPVTMVYGNSTDWELSGDANVGLQTTKAADYKFIFVANEAKNISVVIPEPDPVAEYKYGLLVDGNFVPATKNTEYGGEGEEWIVTTDLVVGNKFQNYEYTASAAWLVPLDPNEGNYTNFDVVDGYYVVKESGNYTFYIKLIYENDNMWVVKNSGTGINALDADAKAVKLIKNGMLIIEKGNKTYNVMGQMIR